MKFKYHDVPTISERVVLGREINRLEDSAIIPFPKDWDPDMLMETFRTGGAGGIIALQNKGYQRGTLHLYADEEGNWICAALRMDHPTEVKMVIPLRATRVIGITPGLEMKAIEAPRPLYGLNFLSSHPNVPVIVVEGEKAADAGRILFPDKVVVTWSGGAGGVMSADWRPLVNRDVIIWPDNDKPGRDAAETIADLLADMGAASVRIVLVPTHFPPKWDLADDLPEAADA